MIKIDFEHTGVSTLIKDYLQQKEDLLPFYGLFPTEDNYRLQAQRKLQQYKHRDVLYDVLNSQMESLILHKKQKQNLALLNNNNTVTVTTGHQLNLMTGPLYFIYKILHVIKICDTLNTKQEDIKYVPVYWMATEDHDFEEINHFHDYDSTYDYTAQAGGYVGGIPSENTTTALIEFINSLGDTAFALKLKEIIQKSYFQNYNLAKATRHLVHELLGEYGILILDANHPVLKRCMIPYFEKELKTNSTQRLVQQTNAALKAYKNQAFAREINLFYLNNNQRERIERTKIGYILVDSGREFTEEEMMNELHSCPEKFSPNVILRPLYQEVILPNVAYVGGGGEIAYWLQLKATFENQNILFPMLVVRNSMLIVPNALKHKAEKYNLLSERMFLPSLHVSKTFVEEKSNLFDELDKMQEEIANQFLKLESLANKTSPTFGTMIAAQKAKHLKGYAKMQKRLVKSEKEQFAVDMAKINEVYSYFFPKSNWQERVINFSEFYRNSGQDLFHKIYEAQDPFNSKFNILTLDSIAKK